MDCTYTERLSEFLSADLLESWNRLTVQIDTLYDMDRLFGKGFGGWEIEYKYRRGGKTLCTLYAKKNSALLITLGKAEREKFDAQRESFTAALQTLYDKTTTYHNGKCSCKNTFTKTAIHKDGRFVIAITCFPEYPAPC